MKKTIYTMIVTLGIGASPASLAGEQVFKINNSLSSMDISAEAEDYETKINHLIDDIDTDGIIFIRGQKTKINSINQDGQAEFVLTDVEIKLKKSIIDKYQNEFSTMTSKLIWDQVMKNLLENMGARTQLGCYYPLVFGGLKCFELGLFSFKIEIKDKEERVITEWTYNTDGALPLSYFLKKSPLILKLENSFSTGSIDSNTYEDKDGNLILLKRDISFTLPTSQIKKIDNVSFSTVKNPRKI